MAMVVMDSGEFMSSWLIMAEEFELELSFLGRMNKNDERTVAFNSDLQRALIAR